MSQEPKSTAQGPNSSPHLTATGKKVAATAAGLAAAVAGAFVVRAVRRRGDGAEEETIFHLKQIDDTWALQVEGEAEPHATFSTKENGLAAARELANRSQPCELIIYRLDGSVQDRHTYED